MTNSNLNFAIVLTNSNTSFGPEAWKLVAKFVAKGDANVAAQALNASSSAGYSYTVEAIEMTEATAKAIERATKGGWSDLWYDDSKTNKELQIAVNNGWARRPSHTQCEWTEAGIRAFRAIS